MKSLSEKIIENVFPAQQKIAYSLKARKAITNLG